MLNVAHQKNHRLADAVRLEQNLKGSGSHLCTRFWYGIRRGVTQHSERGLELVVSLMLILLLVAPLNLLLLLLNPLRKKTVFLSRQICGQGGRPVRVVYFNHPWIPLGKLALVYAVLLGRLALVGRGIVTYPAVSGGLEEGYIRRIKPGIFTLWNLRLNSKIGHEGQTRTEWEYTFTKSFLSDLLLMLRTLPTSVFKSAATVAEGNFNLFKISMANLSMQEAVTEIEQAVDSHKVSTVAFVNPDCLNKTFSDPDYLQILQNCDRVYPDGIGITIAGKILGTPLRENVNGTDMLPFLCAMAAKRDFPLFLFGAKPGVAELMARNLTQKYQVQIAGVQHGYFDPATDSPAIVAAINASGAKLVLVALGAPAQEKWIAAYQSQIRTGVLLGVGGLFDFYSGQTKRAPRWLRELGLEWSYRILQEPGRMWKRYVIGNPLFLLRVVRSKKHRGVKS